MCINCLCLIIFIILCPVLQRFKTYFSVVHPSSISRLFLFCDFNCVGSSFVLINPQPQLDKHLSNPSLRIFNDGAFTISSGKEFHKCTILKLKRCLLALLQYLFCGF